MASLYAHGDRDMIIYNLNMTRYKELCHFFDTNSTIKHCVGLIDRFLLHGLTLKGAKQHVNNYLTEYFLPFFRQVLRFSVILGWCPYHLKKVKVPDTGETILVPEVIPVSFMLCELEVNIKKVTYQFKFYDLDEQRIERKNVKVFIFSDTELIANDSMIHSILNGTLEDYRIVQQIKRFTIQSEYNRSNPTIYLRKATGARGQSGTFSQTTGTDGGAGPGNRNVANEAGAVRLVGARNFNVKETPESIKFQNASINLADNIEFHMEEMRARAIGHQRNYYNVGLEFAPQWHNNLFICPPDMELAATPHIPESRVDQLTMERNLSSTIYQAFGIPESMMGHVGNTTQGTRGSTTKSARVRNDVNIMDLNSFESTIEKYKNFFKDCFIILYATIFQKKIGRDVIDFKPPELYTRYINNVLTEQGIIEGKEDKQQSPPKSSDKNSSSESSKSNDKNSSSEPTNDMKNDIPNKDNIKKNNNTKDSDKKEKKDDDSNNEDDGKKKKKDDNNKKEKKDDDSDNEEDDDKKKKEDDDDNKNKDSDKKEKKDDEKKKKDDDSDEEEEDDDKKRKKKDDDSDDDDDKKKRKRNDEEDKKNKSKKQKKK